MLTCIYLPCLLYSKICKCHISSVTRVVIRAWGREGGISNPLLANAVILGKLSPLPLLAFPIGTKKLFIVNTSALLSPKSLLLFPGTSHQPQKSKFNPLFFHGVITVSFTFGPPRFPKKIKWKYQHIRAPAKSKSNYINQLESSRVACGLARQQWNI